jgi:hypothetical protein
VATSKESEYVYDGQTSFLGGMDSGKLPLLLNPNQYSYSRNGTCRRGVLSPRPGVIKRTVSFEDEDVEAAFKTGYVQGAKYYNPNSSVDYIVALISGELFFVNLAPTTPIISRLDMSTVGGNMASNTNVAFLQQAGVYMIVQDGALSLPLIVDGTGARRSNGSGPAVTAEEKEVPAGLQMATAAGRLWVAQDRQYVAGNIDLANDPANILKFTDQNYLDGGGGFALPINMGDVTGMIDMAISDTQTGQGPLFVFGQAGCVTVDTSVPRVEWATVPIQTVALTDIGCLSHDSLARVNNDVFWRAVDGVRTYRQARAEESGYGKTPISDEMARVLDRDMKKLTSKVSSVQFDNRLLMTCLPYMKNNRLFHKGIIALDFTPVSSMQARTPASWDAFWNIPGVDITTMVRVEKDFEAKCFFFGEDEDGETGLYQLDPNLTADFTPDKTAISWSFESRDLPFGNAFQYKTLESGFYWLENIRGNVSLNTYWKNDTSSCWHFWNEFCMNFQDETCEPEDCQLTTPMPGIAPQVPLPLPPDDCDTAVEFEAAGRKVMRKARMLYTARLRAEISGYCEINRILLQAQKQPYQNPQCQTSTCATGKRNECCEEPV